MHTISVFLACDVYISLVNAAVSHIHEIAKATKKDNLVLKQKKDTNNNSIAIEEMKEDANVSNTQNYTTKIKNISDCSETNNDDYC